MKKEEKIKCFVPALALEHSDNLEFASVFEKIKCAVIRYYQNEDFFVSLKYPVPGVFIEKKIFHPKALGYEVSAVVKSG